MPQGPLTECPVSRGLVPPMPFAPGRPPSMVPAPTEYRRLLAESPRRRGSPTSRRSPVAGRPRLLSLAGTVSSLSPTASRSGPCRRCHRPRVPRSENEPAGIATFAALHDMTRENLRRCMTTGIGSGVTSQSTATCHSRGRLWAPRIPSVASNAEHCTTHPRDCQEPRTTPPNCAEK
jgi:hypothetical protein